MESQLVIEETLIELVKCHPNIFDMSRKDYKDIFKRANSWSVIASQLNIEAEDAQRKWKNLRDKYNRERKERKGKSGAAAINKSTWQHLKAMDFFKDIIKERKTTGNYSGVTTAGFGESDLCPSQVENDFSKSMEFEPFNSIVVEASPAVSDYVITSVDTECIISDDSVSTISSIRPSSASSNEIKQTSVNGSKNVSNKKAKISIVEQEILNQIKSTAPCNGTNRPTLDVDEAFAITVSDSLKRMSVYKKQLAKLKISQILFEVEFGDEH